MKRRNFFKKIAGVITGLVIAPFVIEAKETTGDVNKPIFHVTMRNNNELRNWENDEIHHVFHSQYGAINYKIGDKVVSENNPDKVLGICTGFAHDNSCIEIDGKCWGGKNYFMKA